MPVSGSEFFDSIPAWIIAIVVLSLVLFFVGIIIWIIFKHVAVSRELSHLERMKALEMGRTIGPSPAEKLQSKYQHNVFWICFWIGAVVPIAAASGASSVTLHGKAQDFAIILAAWICVAAISIAGVIAATVLMISTRRWPANEEAKPSDSTQ